MEGTRDPAAPGGAKTTSPHNTMKTVPRTLEDSSWSLALVTAAEKVSGVNKFFSVDVPAMNETGLIGIN